MSRRIINIGGSFLDLDPDALAFITNWETNTGVTMQQRQRDAVFELYAGLKGQNTVNGTDFWTDAVSRGAVLFPLVPLTNTTANALAYELDVFSNGVFKGSFINFLPADFSINGVTGASNTTNRHFNIGKKPNQYLQNDVMVFVYNNDNATFTRNDYGASDATDANSTRGRLKTGTNPDTIYTINQASAVNYTNNNVIGTNVFQRINNTTIQYIKNNNILDTTTSNSTGRANFNMVYHAYNRAGSLVTPSGRRFCGYGFGLASLKTQEEIDDFDQLIQRFNDNIIPAGR